MTRPNCAPYMRTILCLYVPGLQRQILKHVSKCIWIPITKFSWISRTNTCNVNFVGTFVFFRIPQQANIAGCSGFRNCKWIPQNVNGFRKFKWILQTKCGFHLQFAYSIKNLRIPFTVCRFRLQLRIQQQLNVVMHMSYYFCCGFHKLIWNPQIQLRIPQIRLFL